MPSCYEFNYTSNQPQPLPDVWVPCPSGDNCCIGIDLCLSNNICHFVSTSSSSSSLSAAKRGGYYSSYYNARCTDPTYTSPACDKICINSPPDIVYNYTSERWACCGNDTAGDVTCYDPLDEYYEAPAPQSLATLSAGASFDSSATLTPWAQYAATAVTTATTPTAAANSGSESSATSTTSITTTTSSAASSSTTTPSLQSDSLSAGAKAGIGVSVALGVITLIAVIAFFVLTWRKQTKKPRPQNDPMTTTRMGTGMVIVSELPDPRNKRPVETYSEPYRPVFELGGGTPVLVV